MWLTQYHCKQSVLVGSIWLVPWVLFSACWSYFIEWKKKSTFAKAVYYFLCAECCHYWWLLRRFTLNCMILWLSLKKSVVFANSSFQCVLNIVLTGLRIAKVVLTQAFVLWWLSCSLQMLLPFIRGTFFTANCSTVLM